ncbi:MAG: MCP four helix bundle domain-containing protein [Proteobacteria bacterium]|nr:MCP four helix bundle domain-containing protein [Pseudomonadota bacterium]
MSLFKNLRLGSQLQLAFLAVLAFAGIIGFAALAQLSRVAATADHIANESLASVYGISQIGSEVAESRSAVLEILTRLQLNNAAGASESSQALAALSTRMKADMAAFEAHLQTPAQRSAWADLTAKWQDYDKEQQRALSMAEDGLPGDAQRVLIAQAKGKYDAVHDAARRLIDSENAAAAQAREAADGIATGARRMVFVLLVLAGALGGLVAFGVSRAITRPLQQVIGHLREIGAGNLEARVASDRRDELGELFAGVAATQADLRSRAEAERRHREEERERAEADRRALEEVQQIVAAVVDGDLERRLPVEGKSGFAAQLATSINGLVDNVAGVVRGLQRIVDGANGGDLTQRVYVENRSGLEKRIGTSVNQLVGEMAGMVARVKETAADVARGSQEISRGNSSLSKRTEDQAASLGETAASMESMTETVRRNADNARQANQLAIDARLRAERGGAVVSQAVTAMDGISAASRRIADIIGVIDEIAFQTNLLALNAAVEAARAGDQGRGFAVVASEVRNLASRSAEAAKEIKALIQDSVGRVEEGSRLVGESGGTLEQLVLAVKKVADIIAEISAAGAEQSSGIDQVGRAIAQMDELTQQNAALVEEAAAASEALATSSRELDAMMSRYRVTAAGSAAATPPVAPTVERRASSRPWSGRAAQAT